MDRTATLLGLLEERVLVLDGAMGTAIQSLGLGPEDFGGPEWEGCNEHLSLTRPDLIRDIHLGYLDAGADIVETDTFGGTALVLGEYGLAGRAPEINRAAARIAREAADARSSPDRPRFVAGSMGPTTKAISVTGGATFDGLVAQFRDQALALVEGGVDYLLLETCQDTRNVKAGLVGIREAFGLAGRELPVAVSGTIEPMGSMLAGQTAEALCTSVSHVPLLYIGLNCATGPEFMADHVRALAEMARTRVACVPNAGLPDEDGRYLETPASLAAVVGRFLERGWLNLVGGCCGTNAGHVRALAEVAARARPRRELPPPRFFVSGIENVEVEESSRPLIVGERTNVIGSRLFKRLIAQGGYEEASEVGRRQVKGGAQVLDVCLADPDRDEGEDMERFLSFLVRKVKVPLMIDSTDAAVIERALKWCQGKSIINSINLEDGEERFERVVPLARRYGAALVVGTIDEDPVRGMGVTRERKLEIALRSHDILVRKYGVQAEDLIFDPLVFPCATGDAQYLGSAVETIEGLRLIKQALPRSRTILGVSNVSFGLPPAGREVLNAAFLYHCTKAGLDLAIVNSERLERYGSIPEEERRSADDLLFRTSDATVAAYTARFREASSRVRADPATLSLDERLSRYIVEGSKDGLVEDLERKRAEAAPLDIINGPLMAGMDEVGRLFNDNRLIVAEVLQSAEAMKAAVAHLERFMERTGSAGRGVVLLATVKGDVHDIGKNLVEIILSNNGYRVINLGIKVPPHDLIEAVRRHHPDIVGLSGLLVKSAQQMVVTAEELSTAGCSVPLLVGGAALSRTFTRRRIAPAYHGTVLYARDAMEGLDLAHALRDPARRAQVEVLIRKEEASLREPVAERPAGLAPSRRSSRVGVLAEAPAAPDLDRHVLADCPLDEAWNHINPAMLYGKHMGLRGRFEDLVADGDERALWLRQVFEGLKAEGRSGALRARAVYRFYRAASQGERLLVYEGAATSPSMEFTFPRQERPDGLCLADYVLPLDGGPRDSVCLFAVTAGSGVRELHERYKAAGEYLRSHAVQALALETAEGLAEWLHRRIRALWGFPDDPTTTTPRDLFQARYRGRRYSPGYPACPDLADQRKFFALLRPEEVGIQLTEGDMMDPEASVTALVLHHPEATYFSVKGDAAG